jgi:RNA polymerase sigma-70 factor (ECF subfamily)
VSERDVLTEQFQHVRPRLQAVAYSMLGSVSDAEDAVQECWLRLNRSDADAIDDLRTWLTTVVGRICLDVLRARRIRRVDYVGSWLPEPLRVEPVDDGPEEQAELADSLGLALLVVLDSLSPLERLAFVLHDIFALPFEQIGQIIDRTPDAARKLASRARRRVQAAPQPERDVARQRRVVEAFLVAARSGDFDALLGVLAPDVVFRFDLGPTSGQPPLVGAESVARHVLATAPRFIPSATIVLINGSVGLLFDSTDQAIAVLGCTVVDGRIADLDLIVDPAKLIRLRIES